MTQLIGYGAGTVNIQYIAGHDNNSLSGYCQINLQHKTGDLSRIQIKRHGISKILIHKALYVQLHLAILDLHNLSKFVRYSKLFVTVDRISMESQFM